MELKRPLSKTSTPFHKNMETFLENTYMFSYKKEEDLTKVVNF